MTSSKTDFINAISLKGEMFAYETLWGLPDQSTKKLAALFAQHKYCLPTSVLESIETASLEGIHDILKEQVAKYLEPLNGFTVSVHGAFQYPDKLRAAQHPVEVFYYKGDIALTESVCVSVVGARKATEFGTRRAKKLARRLVERGYTIVSGLAAGIDTAAMTEAIAYGGRTIGVIGTPINEVYPKQNQQLHRDVGRDHLLMSHVPFYRYHREPFDSRRRYFPERNALMSALSVATIIVEASDTSGSLTQARAALQQGRKLMILNSLFEDPRLSWPHEYARRGAVRIRDVEDIWEHLPSSSETS